MLYNNTSIVYELTYKPVKNINLRINSKGQISVSAPKRASVKFIDSFVLSKAEMIIKALEKYEALEKLKASKPKPPPKVYDREHCREVFTSVALMVYEDMKGSGIPWPEIKVRLMKSRWGSCHTYKKTITLNARLLDAPKEALEYVVYHEFCHFIHPNHSKAFYDFLALYLPDWKARKKLLQKII